MSNDVSVIVRCQTCGLAHEVIGREDYWAFIRQHYHDLDPDGHEGHRVFVARDDDK